MLHLAPSPHRPPIVPPGPFDPLSTSAHLLGKLRLDPTKPDDKAIFDHIRDLQSPPFLTIDAGTYTNHGAEVVVATASLCVVDLQTRDINNISTYENDDA